eukprot:jgi/Botrbrau1/6460/Bobra.0034s0035.1
MGGGAKYRFQVVTDKGTLDAIGLSEGHVIKRGLYRQAVWRLLQPQGLFVITSCNSTREELIAEFCAEEEEEEEDGVGEGSEGTEGEWGVGLGRPCGCGGRGRRAWEYVDHVRTYPVFRFAGVEGSRVATVAFRRVP